MCLADPPSSDRLRQSLAQARCNLLWTPLETILRQPMAARGAANPPQGDPGLADFVLLITILVDFLETGYARSGH